MIEGLEILERTIEVDICHAILGIDAKREIRQEIQKTWNEILKEVLEGYYYGGHSSQEFQTPMGNLIIGIRIQARKKTEDELYLERWTKYFLGDEYVNALREPVQWEFQDTSTSIFGK